MREQILAAIESERGRRPEVRLNKSRAAHLAQEWACEPFNLPVWDAPVIMDSNLELASAYFFFGNAINFAFPPDQFGPVGSVQFWLTLRSHPELLESLLQISPDRFLALFGPLPMWEARVALWQETARLLRRKYNGKVTDLYEANHWNAPEIVQAMMRDFPAFRDVAAGIPFARRAQLTLFMTHCRFQESMLFTNLDYLTASADLQVFNGLLQLGVLEVPEIPASQGLIAAESDLEVTLRSAAILGADTLLHEINLRRKEKVTACQLDYILRETGTKCKVPFSLALTTAY